MIDFTQYTMDQLIELKNKIDNHIYNYEDGFLYICKVHSYGRKWDEFIHNSYELQSLCDRYNGDEGIVNVYSTNPHLSLNNYGDVRYIVSKEDYDKWVSYEYLKNQIPQLVTELFEWDNRDDKPFKERPYFAPIYSHDDVEEMKKQLSDYDMNFVAPVGYAGINDKEC